MKHCGLDTVRAEIWYCTEEEALVEILARAHGRKWDAIEEAALVRELHDHYHLSQARIASRVGRTQGWVSGRLALLRRPLRRHHGADQKGVHLHVDRNEGDRPHCARDTRAWKGPLGEPLQGVPLHEGDGPLLRALPKSQPQAARPYGARSGSVREVPSCEGGSPRCQGSERGAGGHMAQGPVGDRPHAHESTQAGARPLL